MKLRKASYQTYKFFHEGVQALGKMERNGIRIDLELLEEKIEVAGREANRIKKHLEETKTWKEWTRKYGRKAKLGSDDQLRWVLQSVLGVELSKETESGKFAVDDEVLESIDNPFIQEFRSYKRLMKAKDTFLKGIRQEVTPDGYLHPFFHLHVARTYRSSSSMPNFQNFPVRDPWIAEMIRSIFIPRYRRVLVERDFAGAEVRVSACYHEDPMMVKYIKDPSTDMHRDMAMECFMLTKEQVSKKSRYVAKNMFVFPEFYGSWWKAAALNMWNAISKLKLVVEGTETSLYEHLKRKGIRELGDASRADELQDGTFQKHIADVEKRFWTKRFPTYAKWKVDFYQEYLRRGYFEMLTGFVCTGHHVRNDVVNYPIQGSAFHYLLMSLILIQKALEKYNMETLLVGQIHDSMLSDTPESELQDFLELSTEIMVERIPKMWRWINVPMDIEVEVADESWYNKKQWLFDKETSLWAPKL